MTPDSEPVPPIMYCMATKEPIGSLSLVLWMQYMLEAERNTRDLPRGFVKFESILSAPQESIEGLFQHVGLEKPNFSAVQPEELDQFLDHNMRHHDVIIHTRLRAGKVWIEHDGTAEGFATTLVAAGIPPEDIVLAFQHPRKRPHTGFATGL